MKQKLTEGYIINLMKEEWTKKVNSILEKSEKRMDDLKVHMDIDGDGSKETVISPGLRVKRKGPEADKKDSKKPVLKADPSAGLVYDIESVNDQDNTVTLSRPDIDGAGKKTIVITRKEFEANYERK